jgi:putative addiction module component (TIGR02574 family)
MRPEEIRAEIDQLPMADRLLLVEDIWDSIAASNQHPPISEWQKAELEHRYTAFQAGSLELHDANSVHEELRKKYR